ncbi:MAG: cupredoxin domain-containing protein [Gammaproteobacteria bacterium]|nr:cupredoxin domain-containing protein [Gammaproteobacteria bacterium]
MQTLRKLVIASALVLALPAALAEQPEIRLVLENHRFSPAEITVPAGRKLKLVVENRDATPEEFESYALNREKIVPARGSIIVFVGPLKPGRYEFFGEFNASTARGWLVAQP